MSNPLQKKSKSGIAYTDIGQGKPILFVHGLASSGKSFNLNLERLSGRYRCISIDLPGYGNSFRPPLPVGIAFYVRQLVHFINELEIKDVTFVGHSMGAQIILKLLFTHPTMAKHAILIAPAGFETFTEWEKHWITSIANPEILKNLTIEQAVQNIQANFYRLPAAAQFLIDDRIRLMQSPYDYDFYCQLIFSNTVSMLDEPIFEHLPHISQPILVIFGQEDQFIPNRVLHPLETSETIARKGCEQLPHCQLIAMPEAGHFVMLEQPKKVNEAIHAFLEGKFTDD
ncbi:MAG: alpha/beta hydrolase [Saprospiraceae bacterium]|nr:alpha/beta hydrolase [Saprospiraceae bacterium]